MKEKITIWENIVQPEVSAEILCLLEDGTINRNGARQVLEHCMKKHLENVAVLKQIEPYLEDVEITWMRL